MAATHVVSLFLTATLDFEDQPKDDDYEQRPQSPDPAPYIASRKNSAVGLLKSQSAVSLLTGPTPPVTPYSAGEEFFAPFATEAKQRAFAKPGDPRSLVRSDADAVEWGREHIFNQPRSRAGPLPSGSILDFAKAHEELQERKRMLEQRREKKETSPPSHASRNTSSDRGGCAGKKWKVVPAVHGNGGLTNAMRAVADSGEMEVSWVGTLGFPTDAVPSSMREHIDDHLLNEHQSEVVYVSDKDFDGHYKHYCKTILWPIFHYQVPDHPKSKAYADHSWEFYRNINQAFADKVVACYKKGDTIWVHDYHLLLVPGMVREKLPDAQIGFFLHTAFPSSEVFRCLPTRKYLLEGMLGANLVAFQTEEYAQHFLQTCSRLLAVETTWHGVQLEHHFVNVIHQPIGINPPAIEEARQAEEVQEWTRTIQERYQDKMLIVAIDKLDGVHGVRQKLLAFELFLNKYPEWREKVVLIQVATSTSEQSELLTTIADICGRVAQFHSDLVHQPLVFLKQDLAFYQYLGLLAAADVLMVASLRDGMNLTAHEFIFCQDGKGYSKKHGSLVLSEFTGSASLFGSDQISINPWDYHGQVARMKQALEMSAAEKQRRWTGMHSVVMSQTAGFWAISLNKSLAKFHAEHHERASSSVPRLSIPQISEKYRQSDYRVFIIDYEGTLAAHKTSSGIPLTSPNRIIDTLNDLMADTRNVVYIMSGRMPEELDGVFRTATGLGMIAENGCFLREYGAAARSWKSDVRMDQVKAWKGDVKAILKYYVERIEGTYIEERHCSLLLRYERADDQDAAVRQAGDCADQINSSCDSMRIHAVPIYKAVLVEMVDYTKGTAATRIFNRLRDKTTTQDFAVPDFLMVAGDDREDEVIFRWANELAAEGPIRDVFTVSVGKRNTEAKMALTQGSTGLLTVLQKLAKISLDEMPRDYLNCKRSK